MSIIPGAEKGFIRKKIQVFNNSVGYASGEQGGNLIVKEQWLEEPSWDVYVLLDCEEAIKLCEIVGPSVQLLGQFFLILKGHLFVFPKITTGLQYPFFSWKQRRI